MLEEQNSMDQSFFFIEKLLDAYILINDHLTLTKVNNAFFNLNLLPKEEIVGSNMLELFPQFNLGLVKQDQGNFRLCSSKFTIGEQPFFLIKVEVITQHTELINFEQLDDSTLNSEKILSLVYEVCFELDRNLNIIYANNSACENWGLSRKELMGRNICTILNNIYGPIEKTLLQALSHRNQLFKEIHLPLINRWILLNVHPSGRGLIVVYADITDKIKYRNSLQEKELQLKTLLENIPDLVTRWDQNSNLLYANTSFVKNNLSLVQKSDFKIKPAGAEMPDLDWNEKINLAYTSGQKIQHFTTLENGNEKAFLDSIIVPEKDEDGKIVSVLAISRDITENKVAKQKISDSNTLLQSIFNASLNGIAALRTIKNENGEIRDYQCLICNNSGIEILGINPIGINLSSILDPENQDIYFPLLAETLLNKRKIQKELQVKINTKTFWIEVILAKLNDGVLLTFTDITEKKNAERELKSTLVLMQELINGTQISLVHFKVIYQKETRFKDFEVLNSNTHATLLFKTRDGSLAGKKLSALSSDIFKTDLGKQLKQFVKTGSPERFETAFIVDGITMYLDICLVKLDDGIILTAMDISDKIISENKIKAIEQAQQNQLLDAIIQTQEEERQRISESLHNDFGQLLNISLIKLAKENSEVSSLLQQAIEKVRHISHELMPPILKDFGLEAALLDLLETNFGLSEIQVHHTVKGFSTRLNDNLELAVYRIIQELLNNITKHAQATNVLIHIEIAKNILVIEVEDNGKGFNPKQETLGFGLKYIQSRIELLSGIFKISKSKNKGSKFLIKIPLEK